MKKKIYYIVYSIIQMALSIYTFISAKTLAKTQVESIKSLLPTDSNEIMEFFNVDTLASGFKVTAIAGVIFGLIILILAMINKLEKKKGLAIGLLVATIFTSNYFIGIILAIVTLVFVANAKVPKEEKKEKKKLERLETLKVTPKQYVLTVLLILFYSTQFFAGGIFTNATAAIIYEIVFRLGMVGFTFYAFSERIKRDTREFKKNAGSYIGYAFKCWAVMIGLSMITVVIRTVLGADLVSGNQTTLNNAAALYVVPLAVLWAPIVEEGIFRGAIRRFVKNDVLFIIISAVCFGLLHTITSETGLFAIIIQSLQYAVMGGVFAYAYSKTNNICVNVFMHFFQNSIAVLLMLI